MTIWKPELLFEFMLPLGILANFNKKMFKIEMK